LVFIERAEEVNEETVSFLKPRGLRRWQRPLGMPTKQRTKPLKLEARVRRASQIASGWVTKLRSWLPR